MDSQATPQDSKKEREGRLPIGSDDTRVQTNYGTKSGLAFTALVAKMSEKAQLGQYYTGTKEDQVDLTSVANPDTNELDKELTRSPCRTKGQPTAASNHNYALVNHHSLAPGAKHRVVAQTRVPCLWGGV